MTKHGCIGIFGGGQLGMFLCQSAQKRGLSSIIYDQNPDVCAKTFATRAIIAPYTDSAQLKSFAKDCIAVTYEFENIPFLAVDSVISEGGSVPQRTKPLYLSQNRLREKDAIRQLGVPTARYLAIESSSMLIEAIKQIGFPCILKTTTGGYDGKGQWVFHSEKDIPSTFPPTSMILEELITFDKEVSCMAVRNTQGQVVIFPLAENIHHKGILQLSIAPARIDNTLSLKIKEYAQQIIEGLDIIGPLAIEFFVKDTTIFFNEMAPRPHNSFHWTLDGCDFSQFDLHLAAILGEDLPQPKQIRDVVMLNILGEHFSKINKPVQGKIYLYGKKDWIEKRKMGHINFFGDNLENLIRYAVEY